MGTGGVGAGGAGVGGAGVGGAGVGVGGADEMQHVSSAVGHSPGRCGFARGHDFTQLPTKPLKEQWSTPMVAVTCSNKHARCRSGLILSSTAVAVTCSGVPPVPQIP